MRMDYVFLGLALIFLGLSLLVLSTGNVQYGGVILIGPFPIIIGSSPGMAMLGIVFAFLMLLFMLTFILMVRR